MRMHQFCPCVYGKRVGVPLWPWMEQATGPQIVNKSPKKSKLATHVDLLVPMDELWAQCTWVSLTGLTKKVEVGQVDLIFTKIGDKSLLLGFIFKSKMCG